MGIQPDTKNWTWVLDRPCPDCGFDGSTFPAPKVSDRIRENARLWPELLGDSLAKVRPSHGVWSALEYGCHVRDVFVLFNARIKQMLTEHEPRFANWDQDETAIAARYRQQDPTQVADGICMAAGVVANTLDGVDGQEWPRKGLRSDGSIFTVDSISRYLLHDPVHHVFDVERGYLVLGSRTGRR